MMLRGAAIRRGALELTMKEVKVDLDSDGRVVGAHVVENTESHQIIEEFMLAANEAVAEILHAGRFAVSPPRAFRSRSAQAEGPRRVRRGDGISDRKPAKPLRAARFAETGQRQARAACGELRGAAQLAAGRLQPEEEGHYALASDCYCHFTSPDPPLSRSDDPPLAGACCCKARKPPGTISAN